MDGRKRRVMVMMSGGVDSGAAAFLLQKEGHEVCGGTFVLGGGQDEALIAASRAQADFLGMEHHVFDLGEVFQAEVVDRFVRDYAAGITPNPCVECNRRVKFGVLLDRARERGCDAIATGHYARVEQDGARWLLLRGIDPLKDQSYMLYSLGQEALGRTLFPLGGMTKAEVRAVAEQNRLPGAKSAESQDICFVPDGDHAAFCARALGIEPEPGRFVDRDGRVLGTHRGLLRYTIGQRRGLGVSAERALYVTGKDVAANTVTLGPEEDLMHGALICGDVNLIAADRLTDGRPAEVKIRYSQTGVPATLHPMADGRLRVRFDRPVRAATPGQAAVFYDGALVLGGGTILRATTDA